jgi:carbonic anhydrase/acetyltransferase-like protein (isoleucine patch superfamily)
VVTSVENWTGPATISLTGGLLIKPTGDLTIHNSTIVDFIPTVANQLCPNGIVVEGNGVLHLNPGSWIKLYNNNVALIDRDVNGKGKLIFEQNANIDLIDHNTNLEMRGELHIGNNATFRFFGNGFIKYNVPYNACTSGPPGVCPSIVAGTNSKFILFGSNQNDKILEVTGDMLYPPDNLAEFRISNGLVVLGSRINLGCFYRLTSSTYVGSGLVTVWGAPNSVISGCTFDGAMIESFGAGGAPVRITNSTIKNTTIGLVNYGSGAKLTNTNFDNCDIGWNAYGSWLPCSYTGGSMTNIGIFGILHEVNQSGNQLNLKNVNITPGSMGVYQDNGDLSIKCGNINGGSVGVYITNDARLNMSTLSTRAGYATIGNAQFANIQLDQANSFDLDEGYNTIFNQHDNAGAFKTIWGTLNQPCSSPIVINADKNRWRNQSPQFGPTKYSVRTVLPCPVNPLTFQLVDAAPQTATCGAFDPPIPPTPPVPFPSNSTSALRLCPTCPDINTPSFSNMPYNEAVWLAINNTESEDSTKNDLVAINMFKQILMEPIDSSNADVLWLASLAFSRMNLALTNAFDTEKITAASNSPALHPSVQEVLDVHNRLSAQVTVDNYVQQFYLDLSRAQVYRLAGNRTVSLQLLNAISNCFLKDNELQQLRKWKTLVNAEHLVLTGQVARENFFSLIKKEPPRIVKPTNIDPAANVNPTAQVGDGVVIGANTVIEQDVKIGDNVTIGSNVIIKKETAIGSGTTIGDNSTIEKDVVIGKNTIIKNGVHLKKEVVLGDNVEVGATVVIDENTTIGSYVFLS